MVLEKRSGVRIASPAHMNPTVFPLDKLTSREREVLAGLLLGIKAVKMASEMGIKPKTIDSHRSRIYAKMGVGSLAELYRLAARGGFLPRTELVETGPADSKLYLPLYKNKNRSLCCFVCGLGDLWLCEWKFFIQFDGKVREQGIHTKCSEGMVEKRKT